MKFLSVGATRYADPNDVPVGEDLLRKVRASGMTMSAYLETIQPGPDDARLDAYQRQLRRFNIRITNDEERGIPASMLNEFWEPRSFDGAPLDERAWKPERASGETERFFASSQPQSWALFPEYINRNLRSTPLAGDVLNELIATTTTIDSGTYQAIYFQDSVLNRRLPRVAEGAELPKVFVRVGFNAVALEKFGCAMEGTYEYSRRVRINVFTLFLARIRQQLRLDLSAQAADVLVNGDGNNNAAVNYNVSALDTNAPAGPGTVTDPYLARIGDANANSTITKGLTYAAFLTWRTSLYALGMTTIVGRMNEILQVLTLQFPTINPMLLLAMVGGGGNNMDYGRIKLPQGDLFGSADLVYLPFAPGGLLIGLNKSFALEMLMEAGSDLTETDKDILEQRNVMTISQTSGFDRIIGSAVSTLTFA